MHCLPDAPRRRRARKTHIGVTGAEMNLQAWAWVAASAYAVHVMEEYTFNWRDWARGALGLPVEWNDFYVTNSVVIVLGITSAELAPNLPVAPLAYASLMLINAVLFHIWQVIRAKGRFSPGVVTAISLFLPVGIAEFVEASREGVLSGATVIGAAVTGALLMAYPIVMLKSKSLPYFRQN
jgi:hypothetical protein